MTRFIHLTDLHISHPDANDRNLGTDTPATLRRVVQLLNDMEKQPDFVVASGDLTNMGDALSYTLLRDILAPLKAPLVMALGNHDKRESFHEVFGNAGSDAPYFHDTVQGGLHIITLDTLIPNHVAGRIDEGQFTFLETALTRHTDVPKLIVMHHAPRTDVNGLPWGTIDMASTERLASTLQGHNVVGILSGHVHINRVIHWHGIPIIISNGLNSTVDLLETKDMRIVRGTSLGICHWQPSGLSVVFVPLEPIGEELGVIDQERLRKFS